MAGRSPGCRPGPRVGMILVGPPQDPRRPLTPPKPSEPAPILTILTIPRRRIEARAAPDPAILAQDRPEARGDGAMTRSRQETCRATAEALRRLAPGLPATRAVLGFDGFVDEIIAVVDQRHGPDHFDPVQSIAAMARKILGASGESSN